MKNRWVKSILIIFILALQGLWFAACRSSQIGELAEQELARSVDIGRFMGTWYVHGYTPTFLDKEAANATESYELADDGRILTTYAFNKGSAQGPRKVYRPVARVVDTESNADWRMRFFGLFTAPYYILYVSEDYEQTVIGHPERKFAWIMTRAPAISPEAYETLFQELVDREYELERIKRVPQEW